MRLSVRGRFVVCLALMTVMPLIGHCARRLAYPCGGFESTVLCALPGNEGVQGTSATFPMEDFLTGGFFPMSGWLSNVFQVVSESLIHKDYRFFACARVTRKDPALPSENRQTSETRKT